MGNGCSERFNGKFREKGLNEEWFLDLDDAKTKIEAYRLHYDDERAPQCARAADTLSNASHVAILSTRPRPLPRDHLGIPSPFGQSGMRDLVSPRTSSSPPA